VGLTAWYTLRRVPDVLWVRYRRETVRNKTEALD